MLPTRIIVIVMAVVGVWYGSVVWWAASDVTVSTPVYVPEPADGEQPPVVEPPLLSRVDVRCASAFSSSPSIDGVAPVPPEPYLFQRAPCDASHRDARTVFAIDTVIFVLAAGVLVWMLLRSRRRSDTTDDPVAEPGISVGV